MAKITICDICKKQMDIDDSRLFIRDKSYRVVLRTIENGQWKSKDICIDCIIKNLPKKKLKNEFIRFIK